MSNKTVCLIGGDLRQLYCGEALSEQGYDISYFALDTYREGESLVSALSNADAVLLPVPVMRGEYMNFPLSSIKMTSRELAGEIVKNSKSNTVVFGGKLPSDMISVFEKHGISYHDLCENETFNYLNAVPTSEGAIALCMGNTKVTVDGSSSLVLGYGRIGRCLSRRLKALGSTVTVAARKEKDRSEAICEGFNAFEYGELSSKMSSFDSVFNTVPTTVLSEELLSRIKDGVPVIELASKPGGIDQVGALRYGTRVISAQSLPGRVAPVTAGRIIARCILNILKAGEDR